ncbi:MAG: FKBP-type peptidyl-prolyl cis-trans isomerase [Acutalibacteraceae bacterium]
MFKSEKMRRIICVMLAALTAAVMFAGCGKNDARILYNEKLSKYVKLGDYKNIPVDTKSDTFKEFYNDIISSDIYNNDLYVRKTEGEVANGDTANIDYEGKKDGVAFDGGTAQGYNLTIGSGSFIDGFEEGLIGKKIGDTVDLNLTFPEDYQSTDLAGKAVVFTVKINYVKTSEERKPEDYYKELEFDTLDAYQADVTERAAKNYLLDTIKANSEIKYYPEKDTETIYTAYYNMLDMNIQSQYGIDLAAYLSYNNQTEDDFKASLTDEQIKPLMEDQMVLYAVLDKEKIGLTDKDVQYQLDETMKGYDGVTEDKIKEFYGEYYFEYLAVNEKVLDYLYANADIS